MRLRLRDALIGQISIVSLTDLSREMYSIVSRPERMEGMIQQQLSKPSIPLLPACTGILSSSSTLPCPYTASHAGPFHERCYTQSRSSTFLQAGNGTSLEGSCFRFNTNAELGQRIDFMAPCLSRIYYRLCKRLDAASDISIAHVAMYSQPLSKGYRAMVEANSKLQVREPW